MTIGLNAFSAARKLYGGSWRKWTRKNAFAAIAFRVGQAGGV
jgi:hypothetical protein